MTQLEQQMIDELAVAQGFTNDLASNLTIKGVPSSTSEGLDTLVPKVLTIPTGEHLTEYEKWYNGFGLDFDAIQLNYKNNPIGTYIYPYLVVWEYVEGTPIYNYNTLPNYSVVHLVNGSRNISGNLGDNFIQPNEIITNSYDNKQYFYILYAHKVDYFDNTSVFNQELRPVIFNAKYIKAIGYVNGNTQMGNSIRGFYLGNLNTDKIFNSSNAFNSLEWLESSTIMPQHDLNSRMESVTYKSIKKSFDLGCYINTPFYMFPSVANWSYEEQEWFFNVFQKEAYERYLIKFPTEVRVVNGNQSLYIYKTRNLIINQATTFSSIGYSYEIEKVTGVLNLSYNVSQPYQINFGFSIYNVKWKEFPRYNNLAPFQGSLTYISYRQLIIASWVIDMNTFAKFDKNNNIIDGFIMDLPVETVAGCSITFDTTNPKVILNAKAGYTPTQITLIEQYLTAKKYAISW